MKSLTFKFTIQSEESEVDVLVEGVELVRIIQEEDRLQFVGTQCTATVQGLLFHSKGLPVEFPASHIINFTTV